MISHNLNIERNSTLKGLLFTVWFFIVTNFPAFSQNQPNILFIICDDLNTAGEIFNGDPQVQIPNINALAERGVRFINARSNSPICSPSRASLHSGLYAHHTGYFGFEMNIFEWQNNPAIQSAQGLYQHLHSNGYEVYGTGKVYHQRANTDTLFQNYHDDVFSYGPNPWDGVTVNGNGNPVLSLYPGNPDSFSGNVDSGIGPMVNLDQEGMTWSEGSEEFVIENDSTRDLTYDERSLNYAKQVLQQDHDSAFALAVGFVKPHMPLYAPPEFFDLYDINELELPGYLADDLKDVSTAIMNTRYASTHGYSLFKWYKEASVDSTDNLYWAKRMLQGYYASISYVDNLVGELIDALDSSAFADNTIVIFTSDHGWHTGHKQSVHKNSLWDICTRIPFIVAGPGTAVNEICTKPISLIDVYPTLVDIAQIPSPAHTLDGYSIKNLISDPQNGTWEGPDNTLCMVAVQEATNFNGIGEIENQHYALTSLEFNYIYMSSGEEELYDLANDPFEWKNLADDTSFSDIIEGFRQELIDRVGISLTEIESDDALFYGDFEKGPIGWVPNLWNGSLASWGFEAEDAFEGEKSLKVDVQVVNPNSLYNVVAFNPNVVMEYNQNYQLSLMAKRTETNGSLAISFTKDGEPDWSPYFVEWIELDTNWTEYVYDFNFPDDTTVVNARIQLHFADTGVFLVDQVRIRKLGLPESVIDNNQNDNKPKYIYPNPSRNGIFSIDNSHINIESISLFSNSGQLLHQESVVGRSSLDLSRFAKGVYVVRFHHAEGISYQKIIIQ